jgi:hypothetical protein
MLLRIMAAGLFLTAIKAIAFEASVCVDYAADFSCIYETEAVPANFRQITAVFAFQEGEKRPDEMTATLVATDVGSAAPVGAQVASTSLATKGSSNGRVRFTLARDFPVGEYRIDFAAGSEQLGSVELEVIPTFQPPALEPPNRMMGLRPPVEWHFQFVQSPGPGTRLTLPDVEADPDGVIRASGTYRIAEVDASSWKVELLRNERVVVTEWWKIDTDGISIHRRKSAEPAEDDALFTPPQRFFPFPPGVMTWQWKSGGEQADFAMHGPLPLETPSGEKVGWLVVMRQVPRRGPAISIARAYAPGLGLVREEAVLAIAGRRILHQTLERE